MKAFFSSIGRVFGIAVAGIFSVTQLAMCQADKSPAPAPITPESHKTITLGAGCFWCVEAVYERLDGIHSATSGYMGGELANPSYEDICTGNTGHAEVVQVIFDPKKITTDEVLDWFFKLHDPTTLNRQGNDVGTQYRSAIFFHNDAQRVAAEAAKTKAQADHPSPIVTEITKATTFYPAEVYHQEYYALNKNKNPYCRAVITPKIEKLEKAGLPEE